MKLEKQKSYTYVDCILDEAVSMSVWWIEGTDEINYRQKCLKNYQNSNPLVFFVIKWCRWEKSHTKQILLVLFDIR